MYLKYDAILLAYLSEKLRNCSLKIIDETWVIIWVYQL